VTLPDALRRALGIVRDEGRAAYLEASQSRYRLIPSSGAQGYSLHMSTRYNGAWADWIEVDHFDVSDILLFLKTQEVSARGSHSWRSSVGRASGSCTGTSTRVGSHDGLCFRTTDRSALLGRSSARDSCIRG